MTIKRIIVVVLLIAVSPFILVRFNYKLAQDVWPKEARAAALLRLSTARSLPDLRSAVTDAGTVYVYPDKTWLAVWCESEESDHADPRQIHWAEAIALDSQGEWFQSQQVGSILL